MAWILAPSSTPAFAAGPSSSTFMMKMPSESRLLPVVPYPSPSVARSSHSRRTPRVVA
jgi:hypothetical protein